MDFWDRKIVRFALFDDPFSGQWKSKIFFAWIEFLSKNVLPFYPCPQTFTTDVTLMSIAQQSISTWPTYIICPRHRKASLFLIKDSCSLLIEGSYFQPIFCPDNAFTEHPYLALCLPFWQYIFSLVWKACLICIFQHDWSLFRVKNEQGGMGNFL